MAKGFDRDKSCSGSGAMVCKEMSRIRIRNVERPLESDRSQPFYAPSTFNFELQST